MKDYSKALAVKDKVTALLKGKFAIMAIGVSAYIVNEQPEFCVQVGFEHEVDLSTVPQDIDGVHIRYINMGQIWVADS